MFILFVSDCSSPSIELIPGESIISFPLQFRRDEDFYISSTIELNCNKSFVMQTQWTIFNCSPWNCSNPYRVDPNTVILTGSELYLPSLTLPIGLYALQLTVRTNVSSNLTISKSVHVRILRSGIVVNLVPSGISLISRGEAEDLQLNPGLYSLDLDEEQFNTSVNEFPLHSLIVD